MTYLRAFWWGRKENSIGFIVSPDLWRYRELVRRADVVHIQGYRHFLFVGAALLAQRYGVPYVVQTHGAMPSRFGRSGLKRVFDRSMGRFVLSRASYAVALSDTEVEDYTKQGVASSRIAKIFNPLDPAVCPQLPDREKSRRRLGIQPDEEVILFLARLHEKKGLELLIRAVAALEHRRDLRLLIVGPDDGYAATAERLIAELRLKDRAKLVGPLYGEEKFEAYRAADVYVLPTKGVEGLPTTIVEACHAGTPVIVTRTTDVAELIHQRVGFAVNYDVTELRDALIALLDQPALRQRFRGQTAAFVKEYFDLNSALDRFEALYRTCRNGAAGKSTGLAWTLYPEERFSP